MYFEEFKFHFKKFKQLGPKFHKIKKDSNSIFFSLSFHNFWVTKQANLTINNKLLI